MWKYLKALFTHRIKIYHGLTDNFCRNLTTKGRRIRIYGIAWGPFMIALHILDLSHMRAKKK